MSTELTCDVVVIGGGPGGLAAATALARSRRSVIVVDAGQPRNAPAAGAHNVLGHDGVPPLEILAAGRREAEGYGARVIPGRAVSARRTTDGTTPDPSAGLGFVIELADGTIVRARRLILATGLTDVLPDIPGVADLWGTHVLHCPYCHGWEVRDQRIVVLATGPLSAHQALLFRQLSDDVTVVEHTESVIDPDARTQLDARGVTLVDARVDRVDTDGTDLRGVILTDGRTLEADAVVIGPRFVANADLFEQLGGTVTDHPNGTYVATGLMGATDLPGVWAVGNTADLSAMVGSAAGAGTGAGAAVNADLVAEEARAAAALV
ncbi:NAD(P)/FAD-dependent oxidoreductase [Gordonia soli]|uniref:Putative oxidoreductase n=1 Tax=Gordonia soli NBRC 108243 TaxID=1223545 RepID=M0QP32_9ACTN|nr:NAD(P)/FAD-dependent oxidoreductase [Gordonia soli]GAC70169.1 putative oxidoreductase [Gordonia soli NBRC 108243]